VATGTTILVTGANGQLGKEFSRLAAAYPQYQFLFATRAEMAIDNFDVVQQYFANNTVNFCINCAAYTAVDKAETEPETAFLINATAVGNLAKVCANFKTQLIHISSDYVFDGTAHQPYKETDATHPLGIYGQSKSKGEQLALENDPSAIIIRTSWVFSSFGNNFVKTMLKLMKEKESVNVVDDQWGSPTYAAHIAAAIMQIIAHGPMENQQPAIFNYCSEGVINWYQFAIAIKELSGSNCIINPIPSSQFPTAAKRPHYSVLDTSKIKENFNLVIPGWKESLRRCLELLN
jgi:dTDP-4-dehydrorhamnose reductase